MPVSTKRRHVADKSPIPIDTDKIRRLRESLGLTQAEAARRAGIPFQNWNDVEHGRRPNLTVATLERIAAALGVKARDLLK